MKLWMLLVSLSLVIGCGRELKKDAPPPCGNSQLDTGEACDWGIRAGSPGACPAECPAAADACSSSVLVGDAQSCTAECVVNEPSCGEGDGCCPVGCDSTGDADCTNTCGDGVVEGGESCDGNCPTTCDDRDACTVDSFSGSDQTCSLACTSVAIAECVDGDGCCPSNCTPGQDSDCSATCGNGVVDAGELCDGNCPASCDDGDACTTDRLAGGAATCNAQCASDPITVCQGGDGCCPAGCGAGNDSDCNCVPLTCADLGATCGTIDTGCNTTIGCGTCTANQMCDGGSCVNVPADRGIGSACTTDAQCNSGTCLSEAGYGYPGGYCVGACEIFFTTCEGSPPNGVCDGYQCVRGCTTSAECRAGYECYATAGITTKACNPVGLGAREIGQACTSSMDCAGGRQIRCAGPQEGFRNGYCQKFCDASNSCPSGSHCSGFLCLRDCASNASCRGNGMDGYMCYDIDDDQVPECYVAGTGATGVGGACTGPWDCAGGQWARCGSEHAGGFPGGYCSIACGSGQGSCPVGAHCGTTVINNFCVKDCLTATQCRTGYLCKEDGTIDACWP